MLIHFKSGDTEWLWYRAFPVIEDDVTNRVGGAVAALLSIGFQQNLNA
jgi:hypothetical protein